jgi:hypothetical protein
MATVYWLGIADYAKQVSTITFGTYDATTTRKITIGGVTVQAADTGGTLTAALTALAVLLNASTHPYFAAIDWTSSATQIIGTAATTGVPFVMSGAVTGGTGTVSGGGVMTTTTANSGPNDWSVAANWSGGAVPVGSDDVIIRDSSVPICWGLAQSAVTLASLRIEKTYLGKIGLNRFQFATSADAGTTDTTKNEYRTTYLQISATVLKIGESFGPGSPTGSSRILIDLGTNASTVTVFGTAQTPSETGKPAVRLLAVHASTDIFVRSAPGGVGLAMDAAGEVSTVRKISISDTTSSSRVFTGPGTTITTWEQYGGNNVLQVVTDGTITTVTVAGGTLQMEGQFLASTVNVNGGTVNDNHANKTAGVANTTVNIQGGTIDATQSTQTRTWTTVNFNQLGGTLKADGSVLTISTLNDYSGKYSLSAA